jgi:hypothetical protein
VILIGYDGQTTAKAAVESASVLFSGERAVVLTVWESLAVLFTRTPGGLGFGGSVPDDEEELDQASRERAEHEAQEGATLARERGIDAVATVRPIGHCRGHDPDRSRRRRRGRDRAWLAGAWRHCITPDWQRLTRSDPVRGPHGCNHAIVEGRGEARRQAALARRSVS